MATTLQQVYSFKSALDARYNLPKAVMDNTIIFSYFHFEDFPIPMHSHEFYEINIVTEGLGRHFIENNSFSATAGDIFFIPPNIKHGYDEENNLKIFHIILADVFMEKYSSILKGIHGYSLLFNIEPKLRTQNNLKLFPSINKREFAYYLNEINKLNLLSDPSADGYEVSKSIKTINLICDFASLLISRSIYTDKSIYIDTNAILKVISFIENNYSQPITLETLCQLSNMSRSALLNQFHALCHCSPTEYLTQIRIEKARKLLAETDYTIVKIAIECGFFDSSHFSKTFLAKTNSLPKDYRNFIKSNPPHKPQ